MAKKVEEVKKELSLDEQVLAKRGELIEAKKGLRNSTLQNPHAIKATKKDIARLMTKINDKKGKE